MSKVLHVLAHVGIAALQVLVQVSGLIPGRYQPLAVAVGSAAQAALALTNHKSGQ